MTTTVTNRAVARAMTAGIASMVLTVGLARFLYTPLLPLMQAQAHLSVVAGGWLASINYAGYMAGTLLAASVGSLTLRYRLYRALLLIALIGTAGMGLTTSLILWAILRFAAGVSSVAGLLLSSGLLLNWLRQHGRRLELGVHFAGVGMGIVVSGLLAALMAHRLGWAAQWLVAGAAGILLLIPAWAWMPSPNSANSARSATITDHPPTRRWLIRFTAAYFCAGVGYVVSATFIVAIAAHNPALRGYGDLIWIVVGLGAMPSCPLWDIAARRTGERPALIAAFSILTVSILITALLHGLGAILLSAALYGASFNGITSMTLSIIGRRYPSNPSKAMARLTISFGAAQIIAPAAAALIATSTGSYRAALITAALTTLAGIALL